MERNIFFNSFALKFIVVLISLNEKFNLHSYPITKLEINAESVEHDDSSRDLKQENEHLTYYDDSDSSESDFSSNNGIINRIKDRVRDFGNFIGNKFYSIYYGNMNIIETITKPIKITIDNYQILLIHLKYIPKNNIAYKYSETVKDVPLILTGMDIEYIDQELNFSIPIKKEIGVLEKGMNYVFNTCKNIYLFFEMPERTIIKFDQFEYDIKSSKYVTENESTATETTEESDITLYSEINAPIHSKHNIDTDTILNNSGRYSEINGRLINFGCRENDNCSTENNEKYIKQDDSDDVNDNRLSVLAILGKKYDYGNPKQILNSIKDSYGLIIERFGFSFFETVQMNNFHDIQNQNRIPDENKEQFFCYAILFMNKERLKVYEFKDKKIYDVYFYFHKGFFIKKTINKDRKDVPLYLNVTPMTLFKYISAWEYFYRDKAMIKSNECLFYYVSLYNSEYYDVEIMGLSDDISDIENRKPTYTPRRKKINTYREVEDGDFEEIRKKNERRRNKEDDLEQLKFKENSTNSLRKYQENLDKNDSSINLNENDLSESSSEKIQNDVNSVETANNEENELGQLAKIGIVSLIIIIFIGTVVLFRKIFLA